jgi:hypothetical protein
VVLEEYIDIDDVSVNDTLEFNFDVSGDIDGGEL